MSALRPSAITWPFVNAVSVHGSRTTRTPILSPMPTAIAAHERAIDVGLLLVICVS